jgi:hypothetical protein
MQRGDNDRPPQLFFDTDFFGVFYVLWWFLTPLAEKRTKGKSLPLVTTLSLATGHGIGQDDTVDLISRLRLQERERAQYTRDAPLSRGRAGERAQCRGEGQRGTRGCPPAGHITEAGTDRGSTHASWT